MSNKKLYKSAKDQKISGVCGGIAEYLDIDSTVVRVLFIFFGCAGGSGLLAYILAALIMPEENEVTKNINPNDII